MTYGYYGAKGSRKQSKTKTLEVRRILASLAMTAGILAMPFSVGEAAIARKDGVTGPGFALRTSKAENRQATEGLRSWSRGRPPWHPGQPEGSAASGSCGTVLSAPAGV